MHLMFCKLKMIKTLKKRTFNFFASLQTLKKHEFYFFASHKSSKNVNVVFCKFKKPQKI